MDSPSSTDVSREYTTWTVIWFVFNQMIPALEVHPNIKKLFLAPIPRYLWRSCCADPDHVPNRSKGGFLEYILDSLATTRKTIRSLLFRHKIKNVRAINPSQMIAVPEMWEDDPVHPKEECYVKIVDFIIRGLEDMAVVETGPGSSTGSVKMASSGGGKRSSDDQIVGPSRRPYWMTAGQQAGQSQDWAI
jgi:hypothetical protein